MKKISLFTPCYNEEENVLSMYEAVTEVMRTIPEYDYEYVFIDNHSEDRTADILREIAGKDKHVKVILNVRNFGPSRSGAYGFCQTTGDASICLACDFQDPPELIPEFVKKWEAGYKVVWGKRTKTKEKSLFRRCARWLYYKVVSLLADVKQYEYVTGFGLYDKDVMDHIRMCGDPTPNLRNFIPDYGYDVGLVEYMQPERQGGKSSYNFFRYLNVAITSVVTTSRLPLRLATMTGFFMAGITFLVGLVYFILKLVRWYNYPAGSAPILIGVFFIGSIQLAFMGIIGEYVGEILTRQMNRPLVIEKERINFEVNDGLESSKE